MVDNFSMASSDVPLHQLFDVPALVFPVAVCLEVVLPGPPFRLAVCTREANEAF